MRDEPASIAFRHVTFRHATGFQALDDVTFSVPPGRTVAVVGRSGAGKSTLLRLVNGLLMPTAGEVRVEGRLTPEWNGIVLRRHVGYVLQEIGLFPHMTVADNIGLLGRIEGWASSRIAARVEELLTLVGLPSSEFSRRFPSELSGGQRQRVGVARALVLDPPILLMDEPFGALDPVTRHELHAAFWDIQRRLQRTVLVVTHDLREARVLGQDLGVIDSGRLVAFGRAEEVVTRDDPFVRRLVDTLEPVAAPEST